MNLANLHIEGRIGLSERAEVFLSRPAEGQRYVIKRYRAGLYADTRASLAAFIQHRSRVLHLGLVPTVAWGWYHDHAYVVSQWQEGQSLQGLLHRGSLGPLDLRSATALVLSLLEPLSALHRAGVHAGLMEGELTRGSLDPSSVLVSARGDIRLLAMDPAGPRSAVASGLIAYAPPEQVVGLPLDQRADLYVVAVLLWELLAGRRLFSGVDDEAVAAQVLGKHVPRLGATRTDLPPVLDALIDKGTHHDPDRRFATAEAMAEALRAAVPTTHTATVLVPSPARVEPRPVSSVVTRWWQDARLARSEAEPPTLATTVTTHAKTRPSQRRRPFIAADQEEARILSALVLEYLGRVEPQLPTLEGVAQDIMTIARDDEADLVQLIAAVQRAPGIAATLVRIANSAVFRGRNPVSNIRDAVVRLGWIEASHVALSLAARSLFDPAAKRLLERERSAWTELMSHALATAYGATWLGERLRLGNGAVTFLGGLYHRVGRMAALEIASQITSAPRFPFERDESVLVTVMDRVEAQMGQALLAGWGMPDIVANICRRFLEPLPEGHEPTHHLVRTVSLLLLSHRGHHLDAEQSGRLRESVRALSFPLEALRDLRRELGVLDDKVRVIVTTGVR